jgi:serine/threonine-protein phosphatase 2A regulatory subunit A
VFFSKQLPEWLQVCDAIGEDTVRAELVSTFVDLLKDSEGEVRTAAAGEVPGKKEEFIGLRC